MDTDAPCSPRPDPDPDPDPIRLDAVGLICPEPVLEARKALARMQANELLEIRTDDPLAELDFQVFCERTGHRLVSSQETEGVRTTCIRKVASGASKPGESTRPA